MSSYSDDNTYVQFKSIIESSYSPSEMAVLYHIELEQGHDKYYGSSTD